MATNSSGSPSTGGGLSFWLLFIIGAVIIFVLFFLFQNGVFPNQLEIFKLYQGG